MDRLASRRRSDTAEIFDVFLKLHPRLKQEYFLNPRGGDDEAYESSQMTLLIANQHGIFGLYSMRTVLEYERYWASGSGSDYALGAMHAGYDTKAALEIAEAGVEAGSNSMRAAVGRSTRMSYSPKNRSNTRPEVG